MSKAGEYKSPYLEVGIKCKSLFKRKKFRIHDDELSGIGAYYNTKFKNKKYKKKAICLKENKNDWRFTIFLILFSVSQAFCIAPPTVTATVTESKRAEITLQAEQIITEAKKMLARHRAQAWANMKRKTLEDINKSL